MMISKLENELKTIYKYNSNIFINRQIIGLLILKYKCDNNEYTYEELLKEEEIDKVTLEIDSNTLTISKVNTKLLPFIQYENLKDLVKEFVSSKTISLNILNKDEEKICIPTALDKLVYDINGNTTYVLDSFNIAESEALIFKFFDKILNINNKYVNYSDIDFNNYKYVYIYDDSVKFRFIKFTKNDIFGLINTIMLTSNIKIILHSSYKKIANLTDVRFSLKYIYRIVLFNDDNTFIYFQKKDNSNISIIKYNENKIKSKDDLLKVMANDRKQKDVLVKVNLNDIKNNNYRIGFKLYQDNLMANARNINEIVDENTKLIKNVLRINDSIEQEINKLVNM